MVEYRLFVFEGRKSKSPLSILANRWESQVVK